MAAKKPFALRIDEQLMKAVEKWAEDEFRSANGQIEWIIHESLKKSGRLPKPSKKDSEQHKLPPN
jgi:hypothetical protein